MRIGGDNRALLAYLKANEGKLRRSWNRHNRQAASIIARADIDHALKYGNLPFDAFERIKQSDEAYVKGELERIWMGGLQAGGQSITASIRSAARQKAWSADWMYSPTWRFIEEWIGKRAGLLITQWGTARRGALQTIITAAIQGKPLTSGESPTAFYIGELIKDSFGLTDRQAGWVVGYADEVREALTADGKVGAVLDRMVASKVKTYEYALTQTRAQTIARTETSTAFNRGQLSAVQEAADKGLLGDVKVYKVWSAARNEPCDDCQELDGTVIGLAENFGGHGEGGVSEGEAPPLHPNCRCTLMYETRE